MTMETNTKIKENLIKCKQYSDNIIGKISDFLTDNGIEHTENGAKSELVLVSEDKSCKEIENMIINNNIVSREVFALLIEVKCVGNKIFIRQKRK